jgi:hypothetical protein
MHKFARQKIEKKGKDFLTVKILRGEPLLTRTIYSSSLLFGGLLFLSLFYITDQVLVFLVVRFVFDWMLLGAENSVELCIFL